MGCFVCGSTSSELVEFRGKSVCLGCWNYAIAKMIELKEKVLELEEELGKYKVPVAPEDAGTEDTNEGGD